MGRDLLILGASTWDNDIRGHNKEGQLQDQMADFLTQIKHINLAGRPMAVFGLGDSSYQYFCAAAVQLQKFVTEAGGKLVGEPLYIDGKPDNQQQLISDWSSEIIRQLK
jgi:flavodoxin